MNNDHVVQPVITNDKPAVKADRKGISTHEGTALDGPLRVDVQVGCAGVAGVTDLREHGVFSHAVPGLHVDGSALKVSQQDVLPAALQQDVVAGEMLSVGLWRRHVRKTVFRTDDLSGAWRIDGFPENGILSWIP